jgi:hypothetical protein
MKLHANETVEWNSLLRVGVLSKFHFILYDMSVLKSRPWNSTLRLALDLGASRIVHKNSIGKSIRFSTGKEKLGAYLLSFCNSLWKLAP